MGKAGGGEQGRSGERAFLRQFWGGRPRNGGGEGGGQGDYG